MQITRINKTQGELVFELFDKYRVFYNQPSNLALAKSFIKARLENDESVIFVALHQMGNALIPTGFTQLYPNYSSVRASKNWTLNDLYVDVGYRKQGIGESLIKAAMAFAKENHASFVELSTAINNYNAQSLYEQIGFERQPYDAEFYTYRISLK